MNTGNTTCMPTMTQPIDLDTPSNAWEEEDRHQRAEYEQAKEQEEEEELIAMVEAYEREEAARVHRERELQEFQREMERRRKASKRLQVDIAVGTGSASSLARLHVPAPGDSAPTSITMTFKMVPGEEEEGPQEPGVTTFSRQGSPMRLHVNGNNYIDCYVEYMPA